MHTMPISRSYLRALVANLPIFAFFVAWLWLRQTETGWFGLFVALVLGFIPSVIVTMFVGMFLRRHDELRSWSDFGLASLVGWFLLYLLFRFLTPSF
jgi:chromate transport protein ChrA